MKKILHISLFLFICLIFNMNGISASKATCTYKYTFGGGKTYTFTYEYGKKITVSPTVDELTVKYQNFIDKDYNIVCPKLYIDRTTTSKNKWKTTIKLASEVEDDKYTKARKFDGTLKILVSDNKEKETNGKSEQKFCGYEEGTTYEFQLYWDKGLKVKTIGKNFVEDGYTYTIKGEFKESDFANGNCPKIDYQRVANSKKIIISTYDVFIDDGKLDDPDYQEDLNDGSRDDVDSDDNPGDYNTGEVVTGCEVIPEVVRKWIVNILKFVRYVALALVIALGALDFMKAAGAGEPDAMKKAGQSFMKRMIAVVILFLLPVIVDFILNMVNIYGVDTENIDCL